MNGTFPFRLKASVLLGVILEYRLVHSLQMTRTVNQTIAPIIARLKRKILFEKPACAGSHGNLTFLIDVVISAAGNITLYPGIDKE